jgi:hypothetical protein
MINVKHHWTKSANITQKFNLCYSLKLPKKHSKANSNNLIECPQSPYMEKSVKNSVMEIYMFI